MTAPPADSTRFLAGGGEMGARMRSFGWDATVLGPPAQWPQSLKTIVRVMLDSRYAMWMLWGPEFTFFCNDAYLPTVGNKRDWVLSARADRVWEEIWPEIGPRIDHVLRTGEATWDEELLLYLERRGFPEETYHTFSYGPVYGDDDRITGMLCVVTETTAQVIEARRMRMLSELAAQSARVQAVADLCSGFISVLDTHRHDIPFAELYLLDEASATSRRVGHTASAPLAGSEGLWPLEAVTRSAQPELVCNLAAILGVGPASPWPERVDRALVLPLKTVGHSLPAGFLIAGLSTRAPFDARYRSFLELAAGQISAALADAAAHAAERQRAEALAQIDRAKTVFFSNVSHELRTPLTLILGPAEDLAGDPRLDGAMRECASLIHRNSLRLLKLVNSLLDFSRIEAGRMPSVFEPTDLAAFTRELASSFEAAMHAAGLRFVVEAEPELPPVHVDREHWEKIVLNLLSNAFKFTLTGQVRLALRQDRGEFLLELEDSGIGIPAAELPRLFERFHRVEGAQGRSVEGSGIGLALVHDLVQLHGGKIEVDSTPGVGSTFRIRLAFGTAHLPQQSTAIDAPTAHPGAMATAVAEESLRWLPRAPETVTAPLPALSASDPANRRFASTFGARIVVADDSADMRSHLRSALAPHYAIETVADAREALATLRRAPADLLLSDVMMPGIDGFALLRAVREDPVLGATPVILLSARAGEEARVEGLGAGADDYLIKPFSSRELLARVGATIELVRMRKDASDRERAIAARLEGALADGRVGTAIWNLETDRVEADGNFGRLLGIPPAELAEARIETVRSRLAPSNALRLDAALAEALALSDTVEIDDLEVTHPDGRMVWITARGRVRRNAEGVPIEVSGAVVDITERKQAEAALRASERRLRLAQRAAGTAAWELDIDAGKVFWTPEAYEFFGVSPADPDPIGTWRARVHPEDRSRSLSAFPEFVAHGASTEFEFRYRHPQRGDRRILSHGAVFEEGGRRVIAALSIDVTGRRLAEAEREQLLSAERAARAEAEAATRTKDEFLATLSHELRTPLSVIVSWSRILQQRFGSLDEQLAKGLGLIVKNGLAQSELISDLLDMSRIASGKINLDTGPLDLNDLIMEVVNSQRPAAEARGLGLYAHPIAQPALVLGDATRLQQVLWNLVTNALKFTPSGGEVNVRLARRQDRIDISVTDTGEGIAADFLPHLFGRFRQAEGGASRRHGGLGLGLAIVKQLVELHGGQAIAKSAGKGRGSSFTVRLPAFGIAAMDALEPTGTLPLANDMLESNLLAGLAVLAVEDQPDMLEYLRRVLEEQGARVVVATSGAQALDLLAAGAEAEDVDVLLTDISMPGMDGYEFIRKVRDALKVDAAALPAVALTAFARDEDRNRALSEGFQAHLSKPYHVAHLVSVINRLRRSDGVPGG